jgi:hypothetical protein
MNRRPVLSQVEGVSACHPILKATWLYLFLAVLLAACGGLSGGDRSIGTVGGVRSESAPGSARLVRLRLEFGGFTGQLTQPGGQVVFETPNGATINVAGTDFFLVYNQAGRETYCGNWGGQMWVEANGSGRLPVTQGLIYRVETGGQPAPWLRMPWSKEQFEQLSRSTGSPLGPIEVALRFGS